MRQILGQPGGSIHMSGVGGIGMAGLAFHLMQRGYDVAGSDLTGSAITSWLTSHGVGVAMGHDPKRITQETRCLIRSTAVPMQNPEVLRAEALGIPVIQRGAALAALLRDTSSIAVSGTHGKSTTAALIAHLARAGGVDASFCIGAEVDVLGGVAGRGAAPWFVAEADESDASIVHYHPSVSVITNIEYDHMEHFDSEEDVLSCFKRLLNQSEHAIYCADDPQAAELCKEMEKATSYGLSEAAQVRAVDCSLEADSSSFELLVDGASQGRVSVALSGLHNVTNALGALAAGLHMGVALEAMKAALGTFTAPKRRFETICEFGGVRVISDYAHHPTEIKTVIDTAQRLPHRRICAIFQPHRYTRTRALGPQFPPAFDGVDSVILTPVYAASEDPIDGGCGEDLLDHFTRYEKVPVRYASSLEEAWKLVRAGVEEGDVLLIVGAGDVEVIGTWAMAESGQEVLNPKS